MDPTWSSVSTQTALLDACTLHEYDSDYEMHNDYSQTQTSSEQCDNEGLRKAWSRTIDAFDDR
jgi:hypothetical protein